jgi:hypothetical protein
MSAPLRTHISKSGLSRAPLHLAIILALIFGTVSVAFERHAFHPTVEASMNVPTSTDHSGSAIGERNCGLHMSCAVAVMPASPGIALDRGAPSHPRLTDGRRHSLFEPTPDHPPIIS